ncbi:uncharacterized protein LOC116935513 isoform X1 [Daphnia magna]|uniref:uncharacterized protein LOC116935513 isoform X1 n=1 Tax=Daphnia magna TaxID=35525 RepID=UPI0006DFE5E0|nr:uncharacterized protein LOC116935513 isoform X1 [Daphnia magna]
MARTSENGEQESDSAGGVQEKWPIRDGIKQEILIDLDQSSSSIGEKDWSFIPAVPASDISSNNEVVQQTVLFGSNISDPVNKEKIEKLLDSSTSMASKKIVSNLLLEVDKLSDTERLLLYYKLPLGRSTDIDPLRMPLNPLGSRPEIMQTVVWIQTHLEEDVEVSLPKQEVYEEYGAYCTENVIKPLSTADFGKVMKQVFPNVRPRRLGTRGHSRYCYSGLRKKGELSPPILADLFCESETDHQKNAQLQNNQNPAADTPDLLKERACILVREWAEKLLGINFSGMGELANFLVDKLFVDQRSKAATQWNKLRSSHGQSDDENEVKAENGCEQEQMRELKRKLQQEQQHLATRRQSVQSRHSKKTRVSSSTASPLPQAPPAVPLPEETEPRASNKKSCTRSKRKQRGEENKRNVSVDSTEVEGTASTPTSSASTAPNQPAGKVAIPRLTSNRSPRPTSAILLLPSHSQSPSPTISKPKFVAIQPKPLSASDNGLAAPSLPQLKEEETSRQAGPEPQEGSWVEALTHSYDDELARCWSQPGEAITDSLSPKVQNTELSQLRVLLEQNEDWLLCAAAKKKLATSALLERRNVRFETPSTLSDQNGLGNGNSGAVPPSPNTRRMAFNFTPISPRLTPDVPPSPGSSSQPVQLRQLLSNHGGGGGGGVGSPFVSPGQTPVPSSLPPSQPHSRHNSGHIAMTMDTPTSFVTEASSVSNDSAFVSPLNTPLSVNRSRHNSASNLLVNRVRHSSGASITVRHTPYATPSLMNHGQDGLFNASARSRHSSGGSPSLPRSAPLSPLVQSFPQQTEPSGSERIRQDLRRRHVSAGVVLGLSPHQMSASGRVQTTLNNAVPHLWGSDPLAQEIEGLLDSAPSIVNDSVMNRSQSVPLHRMLQQFQSQVGQGYATASQPSTPFGCGSRNFTYNASATSSPYSYTATPVPAEWNDFNSNANNGDSGTEGFVQLDAAQQELESFDEIISVVYANNHQELAPCLDGLGAEALQEASSANFSQMNFQGSNSAVTNMDSDPSLSCSDNGDGYPLSDLSDSVTLPGLLGPEDLAVTLAALKEAPELNRLVQDVADGQQSVAVPQGM